MNITDVREGDRVKLRLMRIADGAAAERQYQPEFSELVGTVKAVTPTMIWMQAEEVDSKPSVIFFGAHWWESGKITGPSGIEQYEIERA